MGNGVDQHQITNGVGCRPWNHQERSWGMCLRMCPRAACAARAEWVDMCKGHVVGWCMVWGERVQHGVDSTI